jgi:orotidine-5'-phosphate decarboxylase
MTTNPLFVALDTMDLSRARAWARDLRDLVGGIRLGLAFFVAHGPEGVRAVREAGAPPLFLDLMLHDIPNTVAGAVRAAVRLEPAVLTVHAPGGRAMMEAAGDAAAEEAERLGLPRPKVIAVTVLTSLDDRDLMTTGISDTPADQVRRLAALAMEADLDGLVCSPREVAMLRADLGPKPMLVTPGVRPAWAVAGDQKRVMTPDQALAAGASHLVIGRPIAGAPDVAVAARHVLEDLHD